MEWVLEQTRRLLLRFDARLDGPRKRVATKQLNRVVVALNGALVDAKKHVAAAIADEKRLWKQQEQELASAAEWRARSMQVAESGNDDLAAEASTRQREHEALAAEIAADWQEHKQAVDALKRRLMVLNDRVEQAKRKAQAVERRTMLHAARRSLVRFDMALERASALLSEIVETSE